MLTLTENAATAIRTLVEGAQAPADAGLRISDDPTGPALELAITGGPEATDQVVEATGTEGHGARVFLDDQAAAVLADKTLDAAADDEGRLQFGIREQS
ncbi:Fe-S cluster assembly iron-binding protein IscA [Klenkia marina]|uniref:Fe-S cluster assembly iron-binding protein IscA n=1 Tax=Klenkia marina TaxID=1960309 RepID=A0A1G4Y5V7_9ACTN|nr:Fe-S cluster assembly protein HesB [Klenkia marina]SCX48763.1 Fe-S cluster assembly iron-binding protein IscA [Klenkia marina]